ncbi:unnamed protein product [Meloidogyne enterolobii]|uniref:Uncharacterized protein n=1 Tax=Meloidogyne enterolobii TaxID=390850 RepID=A0ACB1AW12_MELEN
MIFHTNPILFILIYFFKNSFSHENKNISLCKALNDEKFKNIYTFKKFISYDFIPSKFFSNSFLHGEATKIKNNEEKINFKNKKRKIRRAMDLKTLENKSKETPKCKIKNGEIYGEEGEEGKKARIMKNRNGFWTQIVHPPSPKERDWVMMTGVEHVIDGVLVCSLSYGGRLVSMGHFWDTLGRLNYYAIMHKFNGPVFLKPEPMTYSELLKEAQENEEVDLALTQLCGQDDDGDGKVYFSTYWERLPGVTTRIWFPGSPESDQQKSIFERDGFRLISLCGYNIKNRTARYVGIWQKSTAKNVSSLNPYEAHYGLTLSECLEINDKLSSRQYVAVQFRVFRSLDEILCCAIWEYLPGHRHWIEIGLNLKQMHQKFSRNIFKSKIVKRENSKLISSSILPRQISHFFDGDGESLRFVVLWSDVNYLRFSREPELWPMGRRIPSTYLNGVESQLQPEKLNFVAKRVERFMRELDIPGFGYSNIRRGQLVTSDSQFRIGSVSKPITAAAVLLLIDQGRLELDQRVFGPGNSIFGDEFARKKPYEKWVTEITVRHLLEHTAGGWNNIDSDPAWLLPTQNTATLIEKVLIEQPLITQPGKTWIYSNFGYQLLGYIIERVNIDGFGYEQFVKKYFWEQVGINDIQVARPTLSEKSRREVLYYMAGGNRLGFNPYDLLPAERIGPWGGWIASPIELLRLLIFLDGFKRQEDILSDWAIKEWATPTIASNETYGLGWSLNIMGFNGWQHDGRMPGSASMLVRLDNGISMAVVVNKEYSDRDFFHELGYILHHFGSNCDWWNGTGFDLFGEMEN